MTNEQKVTQIEASTWLRYAVREDGWIRAGELIQTFIKDSSKAREALMNRIDEIHQKLMDHQPATETTETTDPSDFYRYCMLMLKLDDLCNESAQLDRDHQVLIDKLKTHMKEYSLGDI